MSQRTTPNRPEITVVVLGQKGREKDYYIHSLVRAISHLSTPGGAESPVITVNEVLVDYKFPDLLTKIEAVRFAGIKGLRGMEVDGLDTCIIVDLDFWSPEDNGELGFKAEKYNAFKLIRYLRFTLQVDSPIIGFSTESLEFWRSKHRSFAHKNDGFTYIFDDNVENPLPKRGHFFLSDAEELLDLFRDPRVSISEKACTTRDELYLKFWRSQIQILMESKLQDKVRGNPEIIGRLAEELLPADALKGTHDERYCHILRKDLPERCDIEDAVKGVKDALKRSECEKVPACEIDCIVIDDNYEGKINLIEDLWAEFGLPEVFGLKFDHRWYDPGEFLNSLDGENTPGPLSKHLILLDYQFGSRIISNYNFFKELATRLRKVDEVAWIFFISVYPV